MPSHGGVDISRCICMDRPFAELLPMARAQAWDLQALTAQTGCGGSCGLCRPYLRRMLATGEVVFHEIIVEP
jgi:bacterioferritin-associated ferredoxin